MNSQILDYKHFSMVSYELKLFHGKDEVISSILLVALMPKPHLWLYPYNHEAIYC
ncbi:MAG: hypothetical protein ACOYIG_08975 [Acetivibrionales bacterium]